jgi:uncharacterized protein YeaO (DUF488 family)
MEVVAMTMVIKRVYEARGDADGFRILVDRLWPRGVRKDEAEVDLWLREIAPSDELRKWFGHDPTKWLEFRRRYFAELEAKADLVAQVRDRARTGVVTLLFGAKDEEHNQAAALRDYVQVKG